ncbi:MAG: fructosamine kinase family protein [Planctomycetes bacterium]|nr:fructosamine kinase family protein [Planctomycetota bacterium]
MQRIPEPALAAWCAAHAGGLRAAEAVGGGCISSAWRLDTGRGLLFAKINPHAPAGMFAAEAAGLAALAVAGGPRIPAVVHQDEGFLVLEWLRPGQAGTTAWERLGRALAVLHAAGGPRFGFAGDNWIGATPQPNAWDADGHRFHAARLRFQGRRAHAAGLLPAGDLDRLDRLCLRLPQLVPASPPALTHGDLWSGNVVMTATGPALVDPAAHHGWAEAELAMTALFGGFPPAFYHAYEEAAPLPGWRARAPLHQLYHLLNHLNLFGGGYASQVRAVLERWG